MASSMTFTASFFGGAVATKPATVTTHHSSQLAVRASMDLEKAVVESSNTRRGLVLSAVGVAAASSVAKVALADNPKQGELGRFSPVNPCTPDILKIAGIAVSEYNNKSKAALVVEYVTSAETASVTLTVARFFLKLGITAKDTRTGTSGNYVAILLGSAEKWELSSFEPLRK